VEGYTKIDKYQMARMNKQTVMRCIADHGPINRSAIAQRVGLSIPSVMQITDELLEHGMIVFQEGGQSRPGKRAGFLSVSGASHRFVGVDIGRTMIRIVVVGLDRKPVYTSKYPTEDVETPSVFVDRLCERIDSALSLSGIDPATAIGVCVAMPGLIEERTGNVLFSPNFGWKDVPLQRWMNERMSHQVIVENANRAQGMWEVCTHPEDKNKTVLCVGLGYGIGGAFLQKGKLYYGASGTSGEIGHITVSNNKVPCTCGNYGCLETMASGAALARDAREMVRRGRKTLISHLCEDDPDRIEAKTIFAAAEQGDAAAEELLKKSAEYIGIALGSVINVLDPDVIYLCGGLMRNGEKFLRWIREAASHRQMHEAGRRVVIRSGTLLEWNVALGATQVIPYYAWNSHLMDFMR